MPTRFCPHRLHPHNVRVDARTCARVHRLHLRASTIRLPGEFQKSTRSKVLEFGEEHVCQFSASEDASSQIPHLVAVRDAIALTRGARLLSKSARLSEHGPQIATGQGNLKTRRCCRATLRTPSQTGVLAASPIRLSRRLSQIGSAKSLRIRRGARMPKLSLWGRVLANPTPPS